MAKGMVMPDMNMNKGIMMSQKQKPSHDTCSNWPSKKPANVPGDGLSVSSQVYTIGWIRTSNAMSKPRSTSSDCKRCGLLSATATADADVVVVIELLHIVSILFEGYCLLTNFTLDVLAGMASVLLTAMSTPKLLRPVASFHTPLLARRTEYIALAASVSQASGKARYNL